MSTALTGAPATVPRQLDQSAESDPLLHQDPAVAAEQAALEALLRCWCRETGAGPDPDGVLRIPVLGGAARLLADVRHWSLCGWHRFGPAVLAPGQAESGTPVDAVTTAALLARSAGPHPDPEQIADLAGRVADSVGRTADILLHRREQPSGGPDFAFLRAEQALLLGHPLHPTPKSRDGLPRPRAPPTRPSCAARSRCTGSPSTAHCWPPARPWRPTPPPSRPACSAPPICCRRVPPHCPCTRGRHAS